MDFPRLSTKQRLGTAALIAVGMTGLWLGSLRHQYGEQMYPFAYFLGLTLVSCGVIILAAKRWH